MNDDDQPQISALDKINVRRLAGAIRRDLQTMSENALFFDNESAKKAQEAVHENVEAYMRELRTNSVVHNAQVHDNNYVSSEAVKDRRGRSHVLDVQFQRSKEHRRYKMSWRRAKVKMRRRIKNYAGQARIDLQIQPIVPVTQIMFSFRIDACAGMVDAELAPDMKL